MERPDRDDSNPPSKPKVSCSLRLKPTSCDDETHPEPSRDGNLPTTSGPVVTRRFIPRFLRRSHPSFQPSDSHSASSSRRAWVDPGKPSLLQMMEGSRATSNTSYSQRDENRTNGYSKNTPHTSRALAICDEEERTSRKRLNERAHSEAGKRFKPTTGQPPSTPNPSIADAPEQPRDSLPLTHQSDEIFRTTESPAEVDSNVLQPLSTSNQPTISLQPPSPQNVTPPHPQTPEQVKGSSPQHLSTSHSQTPEPVNEQPRSLTPKTPQHELPSSPRTPIRNPPSPTPRSVTPRLPSRTVADAFGIAKQSNSQDSPIIPRRIQRTGAPPDSPPIPRRKQFPGVVNLGGPNTPSPNPITTHPPDASNQEVCSSPGWVLYNRTKTGAVSRGKLYRVNISPRCFSNKYFNVEPIVAAVFRERFNEFISIFQGAISREFESEEVESEITGDQSRFADADLLGQWSYSVMHETTSCIIRDTYKSNIQRIPYHVKTRAKSKEGLVVDIVGRRSDGNGSHPWPIQRHDVVLDSTRDGQVLIGICFGESEDFNLDDQVFIILDWYEDSSLARGLYRIGNYRQQMSTYFSLRRLAMPSSTTIQSTVKTLMTGHEEERRCLIDLEDNSSPTLPIDGNAETALRYVSFLERRGELNVEQSAAAKKCFRNMRLWCRGMEEDRKSPLRQFLAVTGVPGGVRRIPQCI